MDTAKAEREFFVSISPHIKDKETTSRIIWTVTGSLMPVAVAGAYYFGPRAIFTMVLCIGASVLFEYAFQRFLHQKVTIRDGSALLTGLLLAFNLPPAAPFYIALIGSFVAIILTKQLFGGFGFNIFNPALLGRAFLLISFPRVLTAWNAPGAAFVHIDTVTCATPLALSKLDGVRQLFNQSGGALRLYADLLFGSRGGCIGETCIIALVAGAIFLLWRGYITWHIPVSFLATAALIAWVFGDSRCFFGGNPVFHLLSGGMVLGACFMATDYVTSPACKTGKILFGAGCGFLTMLIRLKGGYPEGVMFSILIMNCFTPLIDKKFRPGVFGTRRTR